MVIGREKDEVMGIGRQKEPDQSLRWSGSEVVLLPGLPRLSVRLLSHITFSWTISLFFPPAPFSSSGGINFNERFVADPEDSGGGRERVHSPLSVSPLSERLRVWTAQLHMAVSVHTCHPLCIWHRHCRQSAMPKQRTAKGSGCGKILEGGQLCGAGWNTQTLRTPSRFWALFHACYTFTHSGLFFTATCESCTSEETAHLQLGRSYWCLLCSKAQMLCHKS